VELSLIILAIGTVLLATCLVFLLLQRISNIKLKVTVHLKEKLRNDLRRKRTVYDWLPVYGALAGIISALLLMWGSPSINLMAVQVIAWMGILIGYMTQKILKKENRRNALHEASVFFKALGIRLSVGYNIPYSLRVAAALTPSLRPPVQRCLQRWSFDPRQALEGLRKEINIPEAETLCYVLLRAYESGGESVAHVLSQGARNIDYKLAGMEEKSFAVGKMRLLLWRVLPFMSIFGLFAGNFAYYAQNVLFEAIGNIK